MNYLDLFILSGCCLVIFIFLIFYALLIFHGQQEKETEAKRERQ